MRNKSFKMKNLAVVIMIAVSTLAFAQQQAHAASCVNGVLPIKDICRMMHACRAITNLCAIIFIAAVQECPSVDDYHME
jgi:hypothetical protein